MLLRRIIHCECQLKELNEARKMSQESNEERNEESNEECDDAQIEEDT